MQIQKVLTFIFFFNKLISIYAIFNDQRFNDTLTNGIISFEQMGPGLILWYGQEHLPGPELSYINIPRRYVCYSSLVSVLSSFVFLERVLFCVVISCN